VVLSGAAARAADAPPAANATEVVRLTVSPAALPVPALTYRMLPETADQQPGNAALLYMTAARQMTEARANAVGGPANPLPPGASGKPADDSDLIDSLLDAPLESFPKEKAREVVNRYSAALDQLRLAALREWCHFDPPFRTEGFATLLPYLNDARPLARVAVVAARLKAAEGDAAGAVELLGRVFTFARHLDADAFLVQVLVGAAVAHHGTRGVHDVMQMPGGPNLYWAMGTVPSPMFDLGKCWEAERAGIQYTIPFMREARTGRLTAEQWRAATTALTHAGQQAGARNASSLEDFGIAVMAAQQYPAAKRYAVETLKLAPADVEQMTVPQVLGMFWVGQYDRFTQETSAALTLPFPQARPRLVAQEARLQRDGGRESGPLSVFFPAAARAMVSGRMPDRRLAALRCVEAVRAYAAANEGKAPESLEKLTDVPAPADPITGRAFAYTATADGFTVEGAPVDVNRGQKTGVRIEVKWAK
ncbi:MAG: hypothetical protein ACAI43_18245, partial [Phycisphaerae bacterium]